METEKEMQSLNDTTATWPEMDMDPFKGCRGVRRLLFSLGIWMHMTSYDISIHTPENNITQLIDEGSIGLYLDWLLLTFTSSWHIKNWSTQVLRMFFPMNVSVLGRLLRAKEGQPLEIGAQFSLGLVHWRQFVHESPKVSEVEHIWKTRCLWRSSMVLYFR